MPQSIQAIFSLTNVSIVTNVRWMKSDYSASSSLCVNHKVVCASLTTWRTSATRQAPESRRNVDLGVNHDDIDVQGSVFTMTSYSNSVFSPQSVSAK